jgi:probable HAF family extracellular repeat protein
MLHRRTSDGETLAGPGERSYGAPMRSAAKTMPAALVLAVATLAVPATTAQATQIAPRHATGADLGTLGGTTSDATAINESGLVVGKSKTAAGLTHAFRWTSGTGMVDLGTLGGTGSDAADVNNAGVIVGSATTAASAGESHAFRWTAGGGMVDLGTLGGTSSRALAVSETGAVTGVVYFGVTSTHGFYWDTTHGMVDLGGIGGNSTVPLAINASGEVVGNAATATGFQNHAFHWDLAHGLLDIGTLGGEFSRAYDINDSGVVVGSADVTPGSGFTLHGYRWTAAGGMVDVGNFTDAVAVNAAGVIAGSGYTAVQPYGDAVRVDPVTGFSAVGLDGAGASNSAGDINAAGTILGGVYRLYLTQPGGGIEFLTGPAGYLTASDLNDAGQVVGSWADNPEPWFGGTQHAMLWSPSTQRTASVADASVVEGDGGTRKVSATVTLSSPSTTAVKVKYAVVSSGYGPPGSAATDGDDFTGTPTRTLTFAVKPNGFTATSATITATIDGDTGIEPDEHFAIVLSSVIGPAALGISQIPLTILNDDPGTDAGINVGDSGIWEGDSGGPNVVKVALTRRAPTLAAVKVHVTVAGGSATTGSDFQARTATVKFGPNVTTVLLPVTVFPDGVAEPDETVVVTLSAPSAGATLGRSVGTVTIRDDDR